MRTDNDNTAATPGVQVPSAIELETPRLRLRQWRESDRAPFAAMNADPAVMEFFPTLLSRAESDSSITAWQTELAEKGWSNWAAELRSPARFIGFAGLSVPRRRLPFSPCVEVGWRLAREYWGHGYATEAGFAALRIGFEALGLDEIVSFTSVLNLRSRAVMHRLGMRDSGENFPHPAIPQGHALQLHCLYKITRRQWVENHAQHVAGQPVPDGENTGVTIRRLEAHETALHRELRLRALRDAPEAFGETAAQAEARPPAYWEGLTRSVTQPGRHVMFLACRGEAVCGSAYGLRDPERSDAARVGGTWVAPSLRRQGIGRALLQAVFSWAREHGFGRLRLWAPAASIAALALYRQAGFSETGHWRPLPTDGASRILELECPLSKP